MEQMTFAIHGKYNFLASPTFRIRNYFREINSLQSSSEMKTAALFDSIFRNIFCWAPSLTHGLARFAIARTLGKLFSTISYDGGAAHRVSRYERANVRLAFQTLLR